MRAQIAFFILSAISLISAIFVITRRNAVHSVIWLVVMLVTLDVAMNQAQFNRQWALALGTVLVLLAELGYGLFQQGRRGLALPPAVPTVQSAGNTQEVGLALYRSYMLPVEIASILLLVAMIGAVI